MPVAPDLEGLVALLARHARPLSEVGVEQARANMRLLTVDLRDRSTLAPVRSVENTTLGGRPARVYRPDVDGPVPTVVFFHGGGYVLGDLDTHDDHARLISAEVGAVVVAVDYRLAPEHPFPAGVEDAAAATAEAFTRIAELGGDATRVAVAGDSAGGNMAATAAVAARDRGLPLKAQLLIYPSTDFSEAEHASRVEHADGHLLTAADMVWFREQYAVDLTDPRAQLLQTDLTGVAAAVVATAELDPLRDEGEAYGAALEKAGVEVRATRFPGLIHGFFGLGHVSATCRAATTQLCADLKELLG